MHRDQAACLQQEPKKVRVSRREEEPVPTGSALSSHRVAVTHGSALSQLRSPLICSAHQLNLRRPSTSVGGRQEVTSAGPGGGVTDCSSSLFDSHLRLRLATDPKPRPPLRSETPASSCHTGPLTPPDTPLTPVNTPQSNIFTS